MPNSRLVCLALCLALPAIVAAENPLLEQLLRDGVLLGPQAKIALPAPTLPDGLAAAEQKRIIESIGKEKYSWEEFTRKSVVAPFVVKILDAEEAPKSGGRRVDLWFVAYGDLKSVDSDDFLTARLQSATDDKETASRVKLLTEAELQGRGIVAAEARYVAAESTLFEKVRISAVTRNVKTSTAESVMLASALDPAFDRDEEFPNGWRSITRDDAGRRLLGEPQVYHGLASYVKATKLGAVPGAMLVEFHIAFVEPVGWFNGANLLRSKLPLAAQDGVRRFRRSLEK